MEKSKIVDDYNNYIVSKLDSISAPKTIYLAGHSRSGCLVMRLTKQITENYPNTRVIVAALDPVRRVWGHEFGVTGSKVKNPTRASYYVYTTDMESMLPNRQCLFVQNWLSGQYVSLEFLSFRPSVQKICAIL